MIIHRIVLTKTASQLTTKINMAIQYKLSIIKVTLYKPIHIGLEFILAFSVIFKQILPKETNYMSFSI